jgi:hypothetical protein
VRRVPSYRLRRRRRGIEPRRRRAGWKAGDPSQPRRRRALPAALADRRRGGRVLQGPPWGAQAVAGSFADGQAKFGVGPSQAADGRRKVARRHGLRMRRLSAGFACRGLDAPGARSAAREPGGHAEPPESRTTARAGAADWERRLSAGFACRGLDAPGARSAARAAGRLPMPRLPGGGLRMWPSYRPRRRRRGIEPRRRRAGWKAGDPGPPPTGSAGFQPASRAGGSMPPARDLRRGSRAVAHAVPPGGGLRMWPLIGLGAADAASSRVGGEPAGKPAIPVRRRLGAPAFSRLRVPGARCPRRAICGAGAGRLPMPRRRADDCACGHLSA